mgnify:FL=1
MVCVLTTSWKEKESNGKERDQSFIAKRCAKELKNGDVVNLGIGLPTLIPNYLPRMWS